MRIASCVLWAIMHNQVVFEAIRRNKHVITANKALVAAHLDDIQNLLKEHPGVTFGYEAAVCGGEHRLTSGVLLHRVTRSLNHFARYFVRVNASWRSIGSALRCAVFTPLSVDYCSRDVIADS